MEDLKQVEDQMSICCCRCYWNNHHCNECTDGIHMCCDGFTPLYDEDWDYIEESEYEIGLRERYEDYQDLISEMEDYYND